jgi:isopentenyl phosphate kinase
MDDLVVIKFGGSAITKKADNKFEMNYDVLERSAKELAHVLAKKKDLQIILVCGVGPFGHTNVVKHGLNDGIKEAKQFEGVKITNSDCDFVGKETARALQKEGLKTKFIPGYEVCVQLNKKVKTFDVAPYKKAVEEGYIPISTGVMVKDDALVWSVMSGDKVIAQLARQLKPAKVLMGTDVDGIYTADPKSSPKAELIEEITPETVPLILEKVGESKSVDVTGGMKGKLTQLSEQLNGTPAEIFNLMKQGNLIKVLHGENIKDTKIYL